LRTCKQAVPSAIDGHQHDDQAPQSRADYPQPQGIRAWRWSDKESAMSLADKAKNKIDELEGQSKEATGRSIGDDALKAEGKRQQAKAKLKQTGEKIKDTFR
jgi:uncharacterized protein YjbJ (UPF0337 family)